jgi:hypothetical protein
MGEGQRTFLPCPRAVSTFPASQKTPGNTNPAILLFYFKQHQSCWKVLSPKEIKITRSCCFCFDKPPYLVSFGDRVQLGT